MLKLFNTMSRVKEAFHPIRGKTVKIYTCGPTVYDFAHLGNLRSYIFADILVRSLAYLGLKPRQVMNITDVGHLTADSDTGDDKVERAAREKKMDAWAMAKYYTKEFLKDLDKLNIKRPFKMPAATDHIREQIALIKKLQVRGYTYQTSDGLYFDTSKLGDYGKLAQLRQTSLRAGARVAIGEKKHVTDFALWKLSVPQDTRPGGATRGPGSTPTPKRQMEWPSPWGRGFPGWHIECSAMSTKYLGQPFDIHTGGIDHIPIHHTNEIAQSESAYGKPLAHWWMHGEFLILKKGRSATRMGKSEGNIMTLAALAERGLSPLGYRYFCLGTHYRKQLVFSWEALQAAQETLERLGDHVRSLRGAKRGGNLQDRHGRYRGLAMTLQNSFQAALEDDLNTPRALAVMWAVVRSMLSSAEKLALLKDFDRVLGLNLSDPPKIKLNVPSGVAKLLNLREVARQNKNWKEADRVRQEIKKQGFLIEDTARGSKLKLI